MTALPDGDQFLPDQTAAQRASDYPYLAPQGGFVLDRGQLHVFDDAALLAGRTAVLSVGSNRAPVQLLRKFGPDALVPVTPAILHDCDIVHNAAVSYYGAVSCTAFPSVGTDVLLNIAWLDDDQLPVMHRTEAVGIAYDFMRYLTGSVSHLPVLAAGGDIVSASQPVFGYAARGGVLDAGGGRPAGLAAISARKRRFQTLSQASVAALVAARAGHPPGQPVADFMAGLVDDAASRKAVNQLLAETALHADGPWKIQPVETTDVSAFL
ncbi:MAG: hypothetical protein CMN36_03675 [SAR116 cluster bacterium]|nr:hypothetical protein [SAR116 cluster bacterium]MEC8661013.1 hypothetical protein [Pseudomonadota bacterium]HCI20118.1 hypothetical protein [Alphaproteobacteria bacterium]|tara:strand:- start:369 stop:1169 length:801 start_codon:yes stop_codon:yes gene_type:complete